MYNETRGLVNNTVMSQHMLETIFDASSSELFIEKLMFNIGFILVGIIWTYIVIRITNAQNIIHKMMRGVGYVFILFSFLLTTLTVSFYIQDKNQLNTKKYLIKKGVVSEVVLLSREAYFEVSDETFYGSDYSAWIKPSEEIIKYLKNKTVKVYFVPNSEHGRYPPRHKVLRIDVYNL